LQILAPRGSCWPLVTRYYPPGSLTYDEGQVTFAIFPSAEEPLARKILLADDSVTAQNMGRKILADAGYEVITVNNGSAALKKISEQRPDLIVLDVYMPGYSGLEVCQRLKEAGETARIPVLLTVGKLEPFKPEEAKRARADAFIVKPFEASELLSALTKLEDKIVPRSEGSKPGRFARSIAVIEEGRYDNTAGSGEDGGWKSRINFPSGKKKGKEKETEQESTNDPAIYNPVNKDLRTILQSQTESSAKASASDTRVDLTALASQGLPKDVTPEEIAALAAAAAQMFGGVPDKTPTAEQIATPPVAAEAETKPELQETSAPVVAQAEANLKPAETAMESTDVPASSPVQVLAAIPSVEPSAATSSNSSIVASSIAVAMQESSVPVQEEPVTMALAAGLETLQQRRRWSAVGLDPSPEESAVSLESEMQKAFAAFAAAEGARVLLPAAASHSRSDSPSLSLMAMPATPVLAEGVLAATAAETKLSGSSSAEPAAHEPGPEKLSALEPSPSAVQTPEVSESAVSETVASGSTESVSAVIQEFQSTASPQIEQVTTSSFSQPVSVETAEPAQHATAHDFRPLEAVAEAVPQTWNSANEASLNGSLKGSTSSEGESREEVLPTPKAEENLSAVVQSQPEEIVTTNVRGFEIVAPAPADEGALEVSRMGQVQENTEAGPHSHSAHGAEDERAKKDSEIAATTAAAWASWRRIRESGSSKDADASKTEIQESIPEDRAAMAAAAGAEQSPEDIINAAESDPEIASIVDSVLAGLRPKIVEEISRKLGKKNE
jgi:CheY-like chemotaxis protein